MEVNKMDITIITELIASLGFPIAVAVALFVFVYLLWKQSAAREDKLMNELAECRAVNANAIATIASYASKLDVMQKDIADIKTVLTIEQE
jgi:ribosomal protein L29